VTFSVTHIDGSMEQPQDTSNLSRLLNELEQADLEHGDIAVVHESGWGLVVLPHGRVIWENVEDDNGRPRHMEGLTPRATLKLMELVADGDLETVEAHSWAPGYGDGSTT
jgi:hypothetical protein